MTTTPHKDDNQLDEILDNLLEIAHDQMELRFGSKNMKPELSVGLPHAKKQLQALIAKAVHEARVDRSTEILAFAKRVQLNGQYVPIETGLIPWLEAELASLQASKETP